MGSRLYVLIQMLYVIYDIYPILHMYFIFQINAILVSMKMQLICLVRLHVCMCTKCITCTEF